MSLTERERHKVPELGHNMMFVWSDGWRKDYETSSFIFSHFSLHSNMDVSVNPPRGLREPRNHARILQSPNRLQWTATESVRALEYSCLNARGIFAVWWHSDFLMERYIGCFKRKSRLFVAAMVFTIAAHGWISTELWLKCRWSNPSLRNIYELV